MRNPDRRFCGDVNMGRICAVLCAGHTDALYRFVKRLLMFPMDSQCFAGCEPEVGAGGTAIAEKPEVVRSVYFDQDEILRGIMKLHSLEGFDCDMTYGNGQFWKNLPQPRLKFDIDPQLVGVQQACSRMLPVEAQSLRSVVFDPPFLTYVRAGREGNGSMVMAKRFAGYWRYDELEDHYRDTISEAYRVLKPGGVLVFKCQDIIHNHKMHCTHANVIFWAEIEGFRLADLFVLPAKHRLPSPNRAGTQKHARIFHSYFLVLERGGKKPSNVEFRRGEALACNAGLGAERPGKDCE